jgi:hypothetical protein
MRATDRLGARLVVTIAVAVSLCSTGYAQPPTADANLAAAISQMRDGDYLRALFTLNDVVSQLTPRPEASAMLARAHAHRAAAYIELDQPERAMAAALLALKADPDIVVAPPEFSPAVASLFADPAGFASAKPAVVPETPVRTEPAEDAKIAVGTSAAAIASTAPATATIYIYRPGHYVGRFGEAKILCDGHTVAELQNGRYLVVTSAPGAHDLKLGNKQIFVIAQGGRTYYVETEPKGFGWSAEFVNEDQGALEIRERKMKLNDAGRTFGTECAAPPPITTLRK